MIKKISFVFLLTFMFLGCSSFPQPEILSTSSATIQPVQTDTKPSEVSVTSVVSHTPRPTLTIQATSTPAVAPFSLTEAAVVSACAESERFWYTKHLSATYYTNGQWGVVVCSDNGIYTKVTNTSLNIVWEIPAINDDPDTPEPLWYWKPLLWSPDGKYLYMEPACLCFIDSPWLIYASGFGLSRLDLLSGQLDIWLRPSHNPWYSFTFSDDIRLFAFTPPDFYQMIRVRILETGEEKTISLKEKYNIVEYRWTPDSSRLVIFTEESVSNPSENGFSIFVYSLKNDTLVKIVDKNNLNFTFPTEDHIEPRISISNLTNDVLELSDVYGEDKFQINIRSGEFILMPEIATPTP